MVPEQYIEEAKREFRDIFFFRPQNPVGDEHYTIIGHKHDENCEYECDKGAKIEQFLISKLKGLAEIMNKKK